MMLRADACTNRARNAGEWFTRQPRGVSTRVHWATIAAVLCLTGCAPRAFEPAVSWYADQAKVRDAAARRVKDFWYLRFNELMISDLDDAIAAGQRGEHAELKRQATATLRAAGSYGIEAAEGEISRMPPDQLARLARQAGTESNAGAVTRIYQQRANASLQALLEKIEADPLDESLTLLRRIRAAIEPAPDDQGRGGRQLALAWAAAPAWAGLSQVERTREQDRPRLLGKVYEEAVVFRPPDRAIEGAPEGIRLFAPVVVIEWPAQRSYPASFDRFGEIFLTGSPKSVQVNVNTSRPMMYFYTSEAKIHGRRHEQLVYVWWYPERPEMTADDPAAGHIDGDTLRITLDLQQRPAIFEVLQSCGCGHLVFVSDELEKLARAEFDAPQEGKTLCVEHNTSRRHDLIVAGQVHVPAEPCRPLVYVLAGYHEVSRIDVTSASQIPDLKVRHQHIYDLAPYDRLERLPLGGGVASMFGADGLVHNAGRREGVLLAPTGILSAGQPRKRGTQKIRWDDYSFEDPRLLETALRLPGDF